MSDGYYHKGAINEVIVTDDALSDLEKNYIHYYLKDKWKNPKRPPFPHLVPQILSIGLSGSLSSTTGSWYNEPILKYFYTWEISTVGQKQWQTKSASSKLTLLPSDYESCYGKYIRVGVKAQNVAGVSKRYSYSTVALITTYPMSSLQISRTDTSVFGVSVLSSSKWSSFPEITSTSYSWQVSSSKSSDWETIPGASGSYFYLSAQHQTLTAFNVRSVEWANTTMGPVASAVSLSSLYYKFESPADLPKLNLWLDAADSSTVGTSSWFFDEAWYFNGSGQVIVPHNSDLVFGSNDFTIEFWCYFDKAPFGNLYSKRPVTTAAGGGYCGVVIGAYSNFSLYITTNGTTWGISNPNVAVPDVEKWQHIAVVRNKNAVTFYKNGIGVYTVGIAGSVFDRSSNVTIGAEGNVPTQFLDSGYISNYRIVNGTALYTKDFDVPTSPLKKVDGTVLLSLQDLTLQDNGGFGNVLTTKGTVAVQPITQVVNSWIDKSPYALSAIRTKSNVPTFKYKLAEINGLNVIDFGSSSNANFLSLNSAISTNIDWSHFVAYRRPVNTTYSVSLGTLGKKESTFAHQADNKAYSATKFTSNTILSTGVNIGSVKKNDSLKINKIVQPGYNQAWTGSTTTSSSEVGRFSNGSSYFYHNDAMCEIVHANVLLPDYEITLVDNYLFTKWKTLTKKPYCIIKPTFVTSNSASLSVDKGMWGPEVFKYYYDWFTSSANSGPWTSLSLDLSSTLFSVTPAHSGLYFYVSVSAENVLGISPAPSATDVLQLTSVVIKDPISNKTSLVGVSGVAGVLDSTLPLSTTNVWQICSALVPFWSDLTGPGYTTSYYYLSSEYNSIIVSAGLSGFNVRYSTFGINGFSSLTASSLPTYIKKYESPKDFSDLALWLDASDQSTVLTTGKPDFGPKSTYGVNFANNSSNYVTVTTIDGSNILPASPQPWMIECFINITGTTGTAQCIAGNVFSGSGGWEFNISSNLTSIALTAKTGASIGASYNFQTKTWYHVCLSVDPSSNTAKIFINGELAGSSSVSFSGLIDKSSFNIGKLGYSTYQYPFNGYISNFRILTGSAANIISSPTIQIPVPTNGKLSCLTRGTSFQDYTAKCNVASVGNLALEPVNITIKYGIYVNAWLDKSSNNLSAVQTIFNNKPSYGPSYTMNDLSAVWFDATNDFLTLNKPLSLVNGPHTHYFVYNRPSASGIYSVSLGLSGGAASSSSEILYTHWGYDNRIYFGAGKGYSSTGLVSGGTLLGCTVPNSKLYLNKQSKSIASTTWGNTTTNTVDTVGRARTNQGWHNGLMGEIVHITSELPEFERIIVENQLYDKWFIIKTVPEVITNPVIFENSLTSTLSSTRGTWTASPTSYDIQWQVSSDNGATWLDIPLATTTELPPLFNSAVENYRTKIIAKNINGSSLPAYSNVLTFGSTGFDDVQTTTYQLSFFSVPETDINIMGVNYYTLSADDYATTIYQVSSFSAPETEINSMGVNYYTLSTEDSSTTSYELSSFSAPEGEVHTMGVNYYTLSTEDSSTTAYQLSSFSTPISSFKSRFPLSFKTFNLFRSSIYGVSSNAFQELSASSTDPITTWLWEVSSSAATGFSTTYTNSGLLYLSGLSMDVDASLSPVNVKLSVVYKGYTYSANNVVKVEPYVGINSIPDLQLWLDAKDSATVKSYKWFFDESWIFNGSNSFLRVADNGEFDFGTGDFAIECWVNFSSYRSPYGTTLVDSRTDNTNGDFYVFSIDSSGKLSFNIGSTGTATNVIRSTNSVPLSLWSHVAVTRSGGVCRLFINGNNDGSANLSTVGNASQILVGANAFRSSASTTYFSGFISNLRIVKGSAVYNTFPFTPSNSPLTPVAGAGVTTPLLTLQDETIINNGNVSGISITSNGSIGVRANSLELSSWSDKSLNSLKMNSPEPYLNYSPSISSDKGSNVVVFNGIGDYLTFSSPISVNEGFTAFFVYNRDGLLIKSVSLGNSFASSTSPYLHWDTNVLYSGDSTFNASTLNGRIIAGVRKNQRMFLNDVAVPYTGPWGGTKHSTVDSIGRYHGSHYHKGVFCEYVQTSRLLPDIEMSLVTRTLSSKWL